jgi:hypothetical protein
MLKTVTVVIKAKTRKDCQMKGLDNKYQQS